MQKYKKIMRGKGRAPNEDERLKENQRECKEQQIDVVRYLILRWGRMERKVSGVDELWF